jgi:transcriptional regulator with XRE-family HTH domain
MTINEERYWEAIATVIRAEMAARKMSQQELAEKACIGRPALNAYLNGKREMPFMTYMRVADALGFTPAGLAEAAEARIQRAQ